MPFARDKSGDKKSNSQLKAEAKENKKRAELAAAAAVQQAIQAERDRKAQAAAEKSELEKKKRLEEAAAAEKARNSTKTGILMTQKMLNDGLAMASARDSGRETHANALLGLMTVRPQKHIVFCTGSDGITYCAISGSVQLSTTAAQYLESNAIRYIQVAENAIRGELSAIASWVAKSNDYGGTEDTCGEKQLITARLSTGVSINRGSVLALRVTDSNKVEQSTPCLSCRYCLGWYASQ